MCEFWQIVCHSPPFAGVFLLFFFSVFFGGGRRCCHFKISTAMFAMCWINPAAVVLFLLLFIYWHFSLPPMKDVKWKCKWCNEMNKNDDAPQVMNNSWDLRSLWIYLKGSPLSCKIHWGNVNGNVITLVNLFLCAHAGKCANWFFSRFSPCFLLQPCSITNYLPSCWLLVSDMWAPGVSLPGQGQTVPCGRQAWQFFHTFLFEKCPCPFDQGQIHPAFLNFQLSVGRVRLRSLWIALTAVELL